MTYTVTVNNDGLGAATSTEWDFIVNGDTLVSLPEALAFLPQDSSSFSQDVEISLCETGKYRATSNCNGVSGNAVECSDTASIFFDIAQIEPRHNQNLP